MTLDGLALAALIILIFNMLYFQITSPAFLLVSLEIPTVSTLLRGQFWFYFLSLSLTAAAATLAFAVSGRLVVAAGIATIAAFAMFPGSGSAGTWMPNWRHATAAIAVRRAGCAGCTGSAC